MHLGSIVTVVYNFCQNLIGGMGYFGLSLVMFLENVFPPIPSEIFLPFAGTLTISTPTQPAKFTMFWAIFWGTVGTFLGAWIWYWVGYIIGEERIRRLLRKIGKYIMITENDLDTSKKWFSKYGELCVFFGRMIPIIRTLISVPAGLAKMSWWKFSIFTLAGTVIWNTFLTLAGRLVGANYLVIATYMDKYQNIIIFLLVLAIALFYWSRIRSKKKTKAANAGSMNAVTGTDSSDFQNVSSAKEDLTENGNSESDFKQHEKNQK